MKNSNELIMDINSIDDIKILKTKKNIKYININIENPDIEVIQYFMENGKNYRYGELFDNNRGYIYVSHEIFKYAQTRLLEIISQIPITLKEIEIARYLYITIGKNIGYDINILPEKNETIDLKEITTINNIWGSTYYKKATNISYTKLYLYLCRFMNIDCQILTTNKTGYKKNLLTIQNRNIIVDITKDIPNIQGNYKTKYFLGFNDNISLDKKLGYIINNYSEELIDNALKNIDYQKENLIKEILTKTSKIIDIKNIRPTELRIIYENIFSKYCPNHNVKIYNFYINNNNQKQHFIIINHKEEYYSFNYNANKFINIDKSIIKQNIENQKIGIYLDESVPFLPQEEARTLS